MTDPDGQLSVYQRVLAEDFALLAPELQRYFARPDDGSHGRGDGVFDVAGPTKRWLAPLFASFAAGRMLFPERGRNVPFSVVNRPVGDALEGERIFRFPARTRTMVDRMDAVGGELHDFLGTGRQLEVALALSVENGRLAMVSTAARVHIGRRRMRLPALLSARVVLTEQWEDDHQRVSVTLQHPLLGEIFSYRGTFTYRIESD